MSLLDDLRALSNADFERAPAPLRSYIACLENAMRLYRGLAIGVPVGLISWWLLAAVISHSGR